MSVTAGGSGSSLANNDGGETADSGKRVDIGLPSTQLSTLTQLAV